MPDHHAPGLSSATALLFTWSLLTFAVRAWVKLGRSEGWGWDDSAVAGALVFAVFHIVCIFSAVNDGLGVLHESLSESTQARIEKALFAGQIFYVVSVGLSKISTGLFIAQLTRHGSQVKRAYAIAILCGTWTIACILVVALRGNLHQPWSTSDGSSVMFVRWIIVEASGLVLEFALWGLTLNIIWKLSMPWGKRCAILAIFGCRLLLTPLVSLRLLWLSPSKNPDYPLDSMTANILTEVVLQFAFISASVTCFKPFLKPFNSSYVVSTVGHSVSNWRSTGNRSGNRNSSKDPYYVLSEIRGADKNGVMVSTTTQDSETTAVTNKELQSNRRSFRPDNFQREATISAASHNSSQGARGVDDRIIRKTETWSVTVEGRNSLREEKEGNSPTPSGSLIKE